MNDASDKFIEKALHRHFVEYSSNHNLNRGRSEEAGNGGGYLRCNVVDNIRMTRDSWGQDVRLISLQLPFVTSTLLATGSATGSAMGSDNSQGLSNLAVVAFISIRIVCR